MAIGNVIQKRLMIIIYDEKGHFLDTISVGSGEKDGLTGYTSTTVNVRKGLSSLTYNEEGRFLYSKSTS